MRITELLAALCCTLGTAYGQMPTLSDNDAFTGNNTFPKINSVALVDGTKYPLTAAGINQALTDACDGRKPGKVELPMGTITISAAIAPPSNCAIEGHGAKNSILQADIRLNAPVILVSGKTRVTLSNFGSDGNRSANSNIFDCFQITNSTDITLDRVRGANCISNGVAILYASSKITVQRSEFDRDGFALPSSNGGGIGISPGSSAMSNIKIVLNDVHDNNQGIAAFNGSNSANNLDGLLIAENVIKSNATDGVNITSSGNQSGGKILAPRITGNESGCNGWPANGTGVSRRCAPGFLQSGSDPSPTGVGFDLIGALTIKGTVSANRAHDNVFDGFSNDAHLLTIVNTSGTAVTWVSGPKFNTSWKARQPIGIKNAIYLLSGPPVDDSHLTFLSSAGTQTDVQFLGPAWVNNSFTGNISDHDGVGKVGTGFYLQSADGDVFSENQALFGNLGGFVCNACSFTSFNGDRARSNRGAGFVSTGGLSNTYSNIAADDPQTSPTQTIGVRLDVNTSNAIVSSPLIFGSSLPNSVVDKGTGNIYSRPVAGNRRSRTR